MLLSREEALAKLLPYQEDFVGIFRAMDGLPVTIRLLDPPLHEFYLMKMMRSKNWRRYERRRRRIKGYS